MHDYQDDTAITLEDIDAALTETSNLLGAWWYVTPSPAYNRTQALAAWERHQDATIVTNGKEYGVLLEVYALQAGWHETSPEELEAL